MKLCPECHRLSRDDDFCSHCGAAVYGNDNYSDSAMISCDSISGHDHRQETFSQSGYTSGPVVNGPDYKGKDFTKMPDKTPKKKAGGIVKLIIVVIIIMSILDSMNITFSDIKWWLEELFYELG